MSLRSDARKFAEDAYKQALRGLFQFVEDRIDWRWANAPLLALEAERMVYSLEHDPRRIAFRKIRIDYWRNRARRFGAKAWAQDHVLAAACGICHPDNVPPKSLA